MTAALSPSAQQAPTPAMPRAIDALRSETYDVLVVGGGVYGAWAALDAAQRGLKAGLIEQQDFGGATSGNSQRILHGGLRYLQHADLKRMRESIRERSIAMAAAPHLTEPMPFLVPTYPLSVQGKWPMRVALKLNDWISADRNRDLPASHTIPNGRVVSREQCFEMATRLDRKSVTAGAVFYDGQVKNSERFTLAAVRSAIEAGADAANYVRATGFVRDSDAVTGVEATDVLTGEAFTIRAKQTLACTGPWAAETLRGVLTGEQKTKPYDVFRAVVLVTRDILDGHALAVKGAVTYQDKNEVVGKGYRNYFLTPWRDRTLVGTFYGHHTGPADSVSVSAEEVQRFVREFNEAMPEAGLSYDDVGFAFVGLLPMAEGVGPDEEPQYQKQYDILDDIAEGFVGLVGVKWTTARDVAQKAVDVVEHRLRGHRTASRTATTRLFGGDFDDLDSLRHETSPNWVELYGTGSRELAAWSSASAVLSEPVDEAGRVQAVEVLYAVRQEMARTLTDVVLRRTELGVLAWPGEAAVRKVAGLMAAELGWNQSEIDRQVALLHAEYEKRGVQHDG